MRSGEEEEEDDDEEMVPLTPELYLMLPAYLTKIQECATCGVEYKECHNIGRHKCLIHPGVRLLTNDLIPQRAFYSCCGHSLLAKGCLQIDHAACVFSETSAYKRFTQIRDFSTMIVPHILLRFITRPLHNAMLYDTTARHCSNNKLFRHRFTVMKEVADRSNALLLSHRLQLVSIDWQFEKEDVHEDVSMTVFDVEAESYGLFLSSRESPLFSILAERSRRGKTRNAMLKDCDSAWRSRLGKKPEEEEEEGMTCATSGKDERVQFVIIGRMNTKLDVHVNIKL